MKNKKINFWHCICFPAVAVALSKVQQRGCRRALPTDCVCLRVRQWEQSSAWEDPSNHWRKDTASIHGSTNLRCCLGSPTGAVSLQVIKDRSEADKVFKCQVWFCFRLFLGLTAISLSSLSSQSTPQWCVLRSRLLMVVTKKPCFETWSRRFDLKTMHKKEGRVTTFKI